MVQKSDVDCVNEFAVLRTVSTVLDILLMYAGSGDVSGVSVDIFLSKKKKNLKKEIFHANELLLFIWT